MKGDYAKEKQDHHNFHPPPPPSPQTTFHHPFHREYQTLEEADSHRSPTPTTTKKEQQHYPSSTAHDGATIEVTRRPRGRPPGSKNKPRPPIIITRDADHHQPSMKPYVLELPSGVDIVDAITRFCKKRNIGLTILNGSGAVFNVTLRQPSSTTGATVTFHGRFDILSISATILASNSQITQVFANGDGFCISLAGPQGQVFGGAVVGTLVSATTVYLIAATFNTPSYHRLPLEDDEARNACHAGVGGGGGGDNDGSHQTPPQVSGGGGDLGMGVYGCPMASDVAIWTPPSRQPPPY